jgi:RHS repeat-associated protein
LRSNEFYNSKGGLACPLSRGDRFKRTRLFWFFWGNAKKNINFDQPIVRHIHGKQYEITDHLGNVRAVVSAGLEYNPVGKRVNPRVIATNTYYPFGMLIGSLSGNSEGYRYGFNGQEKDNEIKGNGNSVNFKYRMYDPRIGRFFAVDPLAPEYPMLSTYQFASLNPIYMFELEGLEGVPATKQPNGTYSTAQSATWIHTKRVVPLSEKMAKPKINIPYNPAVIRSADTPVERYKNFLSVTSPGTAEVASNPVVQSAIQTAVGIKAVGLVANIANGTRSLLLSKSIVGGSGALFDLYNQGVSKQDFSINSYDFANAGFKGLKSGLLFGSPSSFLNTKFLGRSVSDFGSDFLSSTIDLNYKVGTGLSFSNKFTVEGAVEFGFRTTLGYGTDKLKFLGYDKDGLDISNKAVRTKLTKETIKLIDE